MSGGNPQKSCQNQKTHVTTREMYMNERIVRNNAAGIHGPFGDHTDPS